jgi:hypothetical protein
MRATSDHSERARLRGERGTSLVIAMAFMSVFGLISVFVLGFGDVSLRATEGYRAQRSRNYATDAALQAAINRVRNDEGIGRDPAVYGDDVCNPDNATALLNLPATDDSPAMVVSCQVEEGSGSGVSTDLGSTPDYAVLTLGDRRTASADGAPLVDQVDGIGTRHNEPGPYDGVFSWFGGEGCNDSRQESGIRINQSISPLLLFGFPIGCTSSPTTASWNVTGDVFSNSKIVADASNAGPIMVTAADLTTGTIKARGGCSGTGFTCTDPGWGVLAGHEGEDPGLVNPAAFAPRSIAGLTVQSVPSDAGCTSANKLVTFTPGIYTDATALNDLFGDADCKGATFWFQPGAYYFDFRNSSTTSYECGRDIDFDWIGTLASDTKHQWCIGGKGSDYSGQRVIAGTPYNWDPQADPTTHQVTLAPAGHAGSGTGFWSFLQQTQFSNGSNAKAIDGSTASLTMSSGKSSSSIWLSEYPEVPRGGYGLGLTLEVAHAGDNVDRMNAPTVQVNWGSLFNGGTCGPYTLAKPPADGSIEVTTLSAADATNLATCLNNGDKINTAVVRYNVSRPSNQGSPYPTSRLDGARFILTTQDQPTFPRPPSAEDPGGDCDPTEPGVQFIFGGDSHVYVPNGGMEICAGPNPDDEGAGQQLAVYGVPATPRLVPASVSATTGTVTNPDNALRIAEGSGLVSAAIPYNQSETLAFSGYTVPAGYTVSAVVLRASYDPQSASGSSAPQFQIQPPSGAAYCGPTNVATGAGNQAQSYDVTSCLTTSNRLQSAFEVKWLAKGTGSCSGATCPQLDGIELIVTLDPTDPNTTLRPQNGCIVSSPNLWYGVSSPDCSLLRVDAPFWDALSTRRGRLSVKGTIYAPSAAIDIDDTDVWYPLASRGLIARHLRIRGFQYHSGYNEPAFSNWLDTTAAGREVVFHACGKTSGTCSQTDVDRRGRAAVTFAAVTGKPTVTNWSVGED